MGRVKIVSLEQAPEVNQPSLIRGSTQLFRGDDIRNLVRRFRSTLVENLGLRGDGWMKRRIKWVLKKQLAHAFHIGQRFGLDVLPRHFYSEIPSMRKLRATDHWRRPLSMYGVQGANADEQLRFVESVMNEETRRTLAARDLYAEACTANKTNGFGPIVADFLYAFMRQHRPSRIIQIGGGVCTSICLAAARDAGYEPSITCIDPYPTDFLAEMDRAGQIQLVQSPVELLNLDLFTALAAGDLLFVDSTHTLGPAGEVTRIILEILPRLSRGVFVHFHDIWFPYDFDPRIMDRTFFWHETSMLLAFLCGNDRFCIRASLSLLHHERQAALGRLFPRYQPMQIERGLRVQDGHYPSSIYLETVA
jgi:methyltransferase family protein